MNVQQSPLFSKVLEIEKILAGYEGNDIGLYTGATGLTLFYARLFEYTEDETYLDKCHQWIEFVIDQLAAQDSVGHTFCRGASGVAWGLHYLRGQALLDVDDTAFFGDLDEFVYEASLRDLRMGYYDFLHGGCGAILYALRRLPDIRALEFLRAAVTLLDQAKVDHGPGVTWLNKMAVPGRQEPAHYNLGLSHGVPSIINLLLRIHQQTPFKTETQALLEPAIRWMLHTKVPPADAASVYPSRVFPDGSGDGYSRLAWCYGDLGIASTLWQAGEQLNRRTWQQEALQTLDTAVRRTDPLQNANLDAGFCHGTAGLAHIFQWFDRKTGAPGCAAQASFWMDETLKQARFAEGHAGYKFYNSMKADPWIDVDSLLEGVCGVGLVMLDHPHAVSTTWDECFLLS